MLYIRRVNLIFVMLFVLVAIIGTRLVWQHSYQNLLIEHQAQLDNLSSDIITKLDKYAHIPRLLSKDKELIDALTHPDNSAQIEVTNRYLAQINDVIQAADTYLLDQSGKTISSSNWSLKRSFIGRNFAWRPYFKIAITGQESQYFAQGSTSRQRGYYYSYPVIYAADIIGVVVVKMDLSAIEENWHSKKSYFVATDSNNIIFMSSQAEWLLNSVSTLTEKKRISIQNSRQYLDTSIPSLGLTGDLNATIAEWENPSQGWLKGDFIVSTRSLPSVSLDIRVLTPKMKIFWDSFSFLLIASMLFAIIYLALLLIHLRQLKQRQIEQLQSEAKQKLEFLVMARTSELHAEIDERSKTEIMLRQTQDELIQAAKLAVIGQMSASISHELNNPLAAIRSFADNGRRFLATGKPERTDQNLARISALTDRMAKISEQLKSFARKSAADEKVTTQLLPIILSAKEMMQSQFKSHFIQFHSELPDTPLVVRVNPIQLEQVLINLLTNALQALAQQQQRCIYLTIALKGHQVFIHIDDNGPGIPKEKSVHLFDPFFTTKKNGLGLGLSISQQIMQSMNGSLSMTESPLSGARFSVSLPQVVAE